LGECTWQGR
jgi:hypothetical protein